MANVYLRIVCENCTDALGLVCAETILVEAKPRIWICPTCKTKYTVGLSVDPGDLHNKAYAEIRANTSSTTPA